MHILRAPTTGSNSSGFNPIFQKFCMMICEIIAYKTVCRIFRIFCRSSFINSFIAKSNFRTLKSPKLNYLESHLFSPHTVLKIISAQISWKNFFLKNLFFKDLQLFSRLQNYWFWPHFFPRKINFVLFVNCNYLILIRY